MCTRQATTALHWRQARVSQGDLKMSLLVWCMLVLFLCSSSKEMVVDKTRPVKWHSYQLEKGQNIIRNLKRHADGTFTSDFTHYLDKIKAKDFVEWLASTKREGCHEDMPHIADV
ncbi:glucagon-1-like [Seriola aureovittata]|uniref:glucagon-1-like n=1 Tax=Seriola aureovittata TaxID=2871759 RepID=UPI0024BE73EB|nr:glucagon-1-like [Seriola aureovittata]XP_056241406.1 glucagon-1-like [Seriola aureovittata]